MKGHVPRFVVEALEEMSELLGSPERLAELLDGELDEDDIWDEAPNGRIFYLHGLVVGWAAAAGLDRDDAEKRALRAAELG